jgi:hypothetical protein
MTHPNLNLSLPRPLGVFNPKSWRTAAATLNPKGWQTAAAILNTMAWQKVAAIFNPKGWQTVAGGRSDSGDLRWRRDNTSTPKAVPEQEGSWSQ